MKNVVAVIGSARKGNTYNAVKELETRLKELTDVTFEYLFLSKYTLNFCNGCKLCFDKGETFCPLKDDRNNIFMKLEKADAVVIATPNYAFSVSARTKNFLDRFAYLYHRPYFFNKLWMPVVTQGIIGGKKIVKFLESAGKNLGFSVVSGVCVNTLEPMSDTAKIKMRKTMSKAAEHLLDKMESSVEPKPSLVQQMMFCMTRSGIKNANVRLYDYKYFNEMGWFESDYYYPVNFGWGRKVFGNLSDGIGKKISP